MSRIAFKRLERLETAAGPKVLGCWHAIHARDEVDYKAQRSGLIAAGRIKAEDFCIAVRLAETDAAQEHKTYPQTKTHEEWVDILAQQERSQ